MEKYEGKSNNKGGPNKVRGGQNFREFLISEGGYVYLAGESSVMPCHFLVNFAPSLILYFHTTDVLDTYRKNPRLFQIFRPRDFGGF